MNDETNDDDDDLLRALGARAREDRREGLARALGAWGDGRVDARQAAAEAGVDTDDAHAELFVPLRDEARERIAAQALAHLTAPRPSERIAVSAPASRSPLPRPRRSRWAPRLFGGGGALVAVAAAAAWLWWVRPAQPLPGYELALEGGDLAERSAGAGAPGALPAPPGVRVLSGGSTLTVALRPLTPVSGPIEARLYVRSAAGRTVTVASTVPAELSPAGAVRWRGTARQLGGGLTGDLVLQAVVGRPGTLPQPGALPAPSSPLPGVARFETAIRVLDEPPSR
jgi:hypothetical protein